MEGKRSPARGWGRRRARVGAAAGRLSEPEKEERKGEQGNCWAREARAPLGAGFHAASQALCASRQRRPPPPQLHLSLGSSRSGKENPRPQAQRTPLQGSPASAQGPRVPCGPQRRLGPTSAPTQAWMEALGPRASSWADVSLTPLAPARRRVSCMDSEVERRRCASSISTLTLGRPHQSAVFICLRASPALAVDALRLRLGDGVGVGVMRERRAEKFTLPPPRAQPALGPTFLSITAPCAGVTSGLIEGTQGP